MSSEKINSDKRLWDYYQTNDASFLGAAKRLDYVAKIAKKFYKKGTYLDIGLGSGYLLEKLYKEGFSCNGVDIASESLDALKKKFKAKGLKINLFETNINSMPFPDNYFDIITASEVLEHLDNKDLKRGVSEILRCLKPNGIFVGTTPAEEVLAQNHIYCPNCNETFHKVGHKQSFSKKDLMRIFKSYKIIEIEQKLIGSSNLNFFGKLELLINRLKLFFNQKVKTSNFIITAKKTE